MASDDLVEVGSVNELVLIEAKTLSEPIFSYQKLDPYKKLSEIGIQLQTLKEINLKTSSAKWRLLCRCPQMLRWMTLKMNKRHIWHHVCKCFIKRAQTTSLCETKFDKPVCLRDRHSSHTHAAHGFCPVTKILPQFLFGRLSAVRFLGIIMTVILGIFLFFVVILYQRPLLVAWVNLSPPGQEGRHFAYGIFKCIFLNENICTTIQMSLKYVRKGPIDNTWAMVHVMAWRRTGDKPLSEPMLFLFTDAYTRH